MCNQHKLLLLGDIQQFSKNYLQLLISSIHFLLFIDALHAIWLCHMITNHMALNVNFPQHNFQWFITARQRSCGKVMFSVVSVILSVQEGGGSLYRALAALNSPCPSISQYRAPALAHLYRNLNLSAPNMFRLVQPRLHCRGTCQTCVTVQLFLGFGWCKFIQWMVSLWA